MKNYKVKIVIWSVILLVSIIAIILLSINIHQLKETMDLFNVVELDSQIQSTYKLIRAYSIGGLAFALILFVLSSVITYAGFKSWRYVEMFG
ncbi:hypothetical protein [Mycoplasma anserisalpingitidis]|uniref:hypothetical protein n=1 Tax=Mycoplasma anserisalpingitidis TaxID=519450 RepID=UPI0011B1116A|nr:hypothetical protein [Mycoplasma anserisalpingitidis]QDY87771.1 hypothetical protein FOY45_02430 [Mycoplasma anserisalpingitidis]